MQVCGLFYADAISQLIQQDFVIDVFSKYPKHKINLWADRLGCENLLNILATHHNHKVFLNKSRRSLFRILKMIDHFCDNKDDADIHVFEERKPYKFETFTVGINTKNVIHVLLIASEMNNKPMGTIEKGFVCVSRKNLVDFFSLPFN